jgi:hypothetical protein
MPTECKYASLTIAPNEAAAPDPGGGIRFETFALSLEAKIGAGVARVPEAR